MSKLLNCCVYLAATGIAAFFIGRLIPKRWFCEDAFPFADFSFERKGRIYERLHIKFWQNKLPDMSRFFSAIMPKKALCEAAGAGFTRMIQETCVAEFIHASLCVTGLYCLRIWEGTGGLAISICNILGNLPFILVQRYNRPRLIRLQKHAEKHQMQLKGETQCAC